jgi:hypothetical protein
VPSINIQLRPLPPFSKRLPFSCLPSFTLSHSGPFRTALLSQSVQSLPRVDDLTPMATICLQQEVDSFSFALPSEYDVQPSKTPPLEGFSSDNEEISDSVMTMVIFLPLKRSWQMQRIGSRRSGRGNR